MRRFIGLLLVALVIAVIEITGRPPGLDPAVLIPMAVLAGAAVDGLLGGGLAGVVGGLYMALYYASPLTPIPGGSARVLVGLAATALAVLVASALRDRLTAERRQAEEAAEESAQLTQFAEQLGREPPQTVPRAIVQGVADLLDADMVVLTVLDPVSGRHIVRAGRGGSTSPVGIEVVPGSGITGQAIRDRRLVIASSGTPSYSVSRLQRRLAGRASAHSMAAVPVLQAGQVIASVTVGRSDGAPFGDDERYLLTGIAPLVGLAVTGSLLRREIDEGSSRDVVTGLYNRSYLDASLEQLIALRRRTPVEQRASLTAILFDIDGLGRINDDHGRHVGDHVLRTVATLLKQRFRASDIVARYAADSFMVAMNGGDAQVATEAAAHIRRQVRDLRLADLEGEPVAVSVSSGCAAYVDGDVVEALYKAAESALESARWPGVGAATPG